MAQLEVARVRVSLIYSKGSGGNRGDACRLGEPARCSRKIYWLFGGPGVRVIRLRFGLGFRLLLRIVTTGVCLQQRALRFCQGRGCGVDVDAVLDPILLFFFTQVVNAQTLQERCDIRLRGSNSGRSIHAKDKACSRCRRLPRAQSFSRQEELAGRHKLKHLSCASVRHSHCVDMDTVQVPTLAGPCEV